ncbi:MAG: glycosyltransferase family 4 protein [Verrucomicrobiae bacterium]|nr:glycosyltransferase family 4 protein [Verrucomicrobiae bacterium]
MKKAVIITGTRWNMPSNAATFPAWHLHESLKDRISFDVWAITDHTTDSTHSFLDDIEQHSSDGLKCVSYALGKNASSRFFSRELVETCEEADCIFLFFRGGNALADFILRRWRHKTLLHLTDNYLLYYWRKHALRFALKSVFEQLHCARFRSRGLVFVSETDRRWFARLFPWQRERTHAIPLGVDTEVFHPPAEKQQTTPHDFRLLFVGDLSYEPNEAACRYLVEKVLPVLPHEIRMVFAGRRPPAFLTENAARDPRIHVTGFVEDISAVYRDCDAMIAPIFHGAGMQNKLLEACASGIPCITTTTCATAFPKVPPNFLLADDAAAFAEHVNYLIANPAAARKLGDAGRFHVKAKYSWKARAERLLELATQSPG